MSSPLVSVVMPARNAAATLLSALESIRDQTLEDIEIVLVDHLSTDCTHGIMREQADLDARIRVLQCGGSFVNAANLAWQKASGGLIARMDSDDFAYPKRLREQMEFLKNHPHLAACGTQVRILRRVENGRIVPPEGGYHRYERWINSVVSPEDIASQRFVDSPIPNPSAMIRRQALETVGGYQDPPWAEDYDLWLRLLKKGYSLGKVPEVLLDWHDSEGRATRNVSRYSLPRFQEAKAHYLSQIASVRELGALVCGAGPIGKEMAALLRKKEIRLHAFIEVNVRQIGNTIQGVPVLGTDHLPDFTGRAVALSAVGRGSGREQVRKVLRSAGFLEGESFFCVA